MYNTNSEQIKGGITLAKGKFESGQKSKIRNQGNSELYAVKDKPSSGESGHRKKWPILAAVAGVAVLAVGVVLIGKFVLGRGISSRGDSSSAVSTTIPGLSRAELEQKANDIGMTLNRDLVLTLLPDFEEGAVLTEQEKNITPERFTLPRTETGVEFDFASFHADLDARAAQGETSFSVDLLDYLTLDEKKLQDAAKRIATEFNTDKKSSVVTLEDLSEDEADKDGEKSEDQADAPSRQLVIQLGVSGRKVSEDDIIKVLTASYKEVVAGNNPDQALQPSLNYKLERQEESLDLDQLWETYCKDAVEPSFDPKTGEVIDGRDGYGFDRQELSTKLLTAAPGSEIKVTMSKLKPNKDAKTLREHLFKDVLAEAHTHHSDNWNRTINLKLACEAINGTVILPGQLFSFNDTVGERTEERGFKDAIAYVGGESVPDLGGGICQVASTIYYAVLHADLETVEREPHLYKVDYVPGGMDATIYWGSHDYKFKNNSEYPIKIEASVANQQVNIVLRGTEWKDYTLELSSEELSKVEWKEVVKEVPRDGTYYEGEVITTPYYGYKYAVYKTTYDKDGKKIGTTQIGISEYSKRDKVIAHLAAQNQPKPTEPKPTQPKPTEPKPTQPKPTQPKPTEPKPTPTQPTPTQPAPTQPAPQPTEPAPTQPTPRPTEPAPTQPAPQPTEPPPQPSENE